MKHWRLWIKIGLASFILAYSCRNERKFDGDYDGQSVSDYSNSSLPQSLDSLESAMQIAGQKLLEVHELSTLLWRSADSIESERLTAQLSNYFEEDDSTQISNLITEMDSLKAFYVELGDLKAPESDSAQTDTLGKISYELNYFSENKVQFFNESRTACYVLKSDPKKFKQEFKFYFKNLNEKIDSSKVINDSLVIIEDINQSE